MRALDILAAADVIAAEDKRTSSNLLTQHGIKANRLIAVHQHNERESAGKIISLLQSGLSVAYVSDAGTPAVSDPGAVLVQEVMGSGYRVIPIPGASAAISALSASGMTHPHVLFYGFLPPKSAARRNALQTLAGYPFTLVFYEAPHRIVECAADLREIFGDDREIVVTRELTKLFETIHRCKLGELQNWLNMDPNHQRGEFVLLVSGAAPVEGLPDSALNMLRELLEVLPLKQAVQVTSRISGASRNELYRVALQIRVPSPEDS